MSAPPAGPPSPEAIAALTTAATHLYVAHLRLVNLLLTSFLIVLLRNTMTSLLLVCYLCTATGEEVLNALVYSYDDLRHYPHFPVGG